MTINDETEFNGPIERLFARKSEQVVLTSREAALLKEAKRRIFERQRRDSAFANNRLFYAPDWDIMLGLFVAHLEGDELTIADACSLSISVKTQTALRFLRALEQEGLVENFGPNEEATNAAVHLTPKAFELMGLSLS